MNEQLPVSEWVSVDEETPIQDVRVWVYVCQRVVLGRFIGLYKDTQQVWEAEGFALLPQVTHWRAIVVPGAP